MSNIPKIPAKQLELSDYDTSVEVDSKINVVKEVIKGATKVVADQAAMLALSGDDVVEGSIVKYPSGDSFLEWELTDISDISDISNWREVEYIDKFESQLGSSLEIPPNWEGTVEGLTISDLQGKNVTQLFETLLFPTVAAYISTSKSTSFTGISSQTLEVGTSIDRTLILTLNKGEIRNGDGTLAGSLVGDLNRVLIEDDIDNTVISDLTDATGTTQNYSLTNYVVKDGSNRFRSTAYHDEGVTVYTNNKGTVGTNLNSSTVAGNIVRDSSTITGRYYQFFGTSTADVTTSSQVRGLSNQEFDNVNTFNSGVFSENKYVIALPSTKTLVSVITSGFEDITSGFTDNLSTVSVQDASLSDQINYNVYIFTSAIPLDLTATITVQ